MRKRLAIGLLVTMPVAAAVAQQEWSRRDARIDGVSPVVRQTQAARSADASTTIKDAAAATVKPVFAQGANLPNDFQVLLSRSMFSPNKVGNRRSSPETRLALRGTALEDGEFTAFLEDVNTHRIQEVREGDEVARGTVDKITLAGITFVNGEEEEKDIEIGQNLAGTPAPAPPPPPPVASNTNNTNNPQNGQQGANFNGFDPSQFQGYYGGRGGRGGGGRGARGFGGPVGGGMRGMGMGGGRRNRGG
jgi:hypothetical protein